MRKQDEVLNPNSCLNKASENEMLFVLLGRDPVASATIMFLVTERIKQGINQETDPKILEAIDCAMTMIEQRKALTL